MALLKLWRWAAVVGALAPAVAGAAVSCVLDDPDKDIRAVFPSYTSYKTEFFTMDEFGGKTVKAEVERKLGDKLDNEYETTDIAHAVYTIYQGKTLLGYVAGETQKGVFGAMQIVLATDPAGVIKDWYYQRLTHPEADKLRAASFRKQFDGLSLTEYYYMREHYPSLAPGPDKAALTNPLTADQGDFLNTLRGQMKDLILLDIFKLNRVHDAKEK